MKTNKTETNETTKTAPDYQNRVTLIGYLGGAPESLKGGAMLSLATKRSWKDGDTWQSETEWHRVIAWGKLAHAVKALAKGDHVLVEGDLRSHEYDREVKIGEATGTVKTRAWEIRAEAIRRLTK